MPVYEFKAKPNRSQCVAIDEAIRVAQFIRNKCLRLWMDEEKVGKYDLNKYCAVLAKEFDFASKLNSQARQASAERAWSAIAHFYDACKQKLPGKKPYPKFKKNTRSVEYKTSGWKLDEDRKGVTFTDKTGIGHLRLKGTWDLNYYPLEQIKRVRLVRRADGYYVQFFVQVDIAVETEPTGKAVGLDVGLESFYTDSNGQKEENPRFYRKAERRLKRLQRRVSKKQKGSKNRIKARQRLGRAHLKVQRQREEHAKRLARCVTTSNDLVAYEDLRVRNMVKNHCLAKSINDAGWYQFRKWLEYFGRKFGKVTVAVPPQYTSQKCSSCGAIVQKSLSTRTHVCECGAELDRDHNAAINILRIGLRTAGHAGTGLLDSQNAWGEVANTLAEATQSEQVAS
ncbi:RNA-guided endonuclease InsQ/TnpB family protein [Parathermosynechococcus lividus]